MISYRRVILLAVVILVTIPLIYFSLQPVYLVKIYIQPRKQDEVKLARSKIETYQEGRGPIYFDVDGYVDDKAIGKTFLSVRPASESEWYFNKEGFPVTDGAFLGTVQLGSATWPLTQDTNYSYKFTSLNQNGPILGEGEIDAHVRPLSSANPVLIAVIGLVASILQIILSVLANKEVVKKSQDEA